MEALMVIVLDEGLDLGFQIAGVEVVFQQDRVFERLMPTLDLTLGLGVAGCTSNMAHSVGLDVVGQFTSDITRAIIAEQSGFVLDMGLITAAGLEREVQGLCDIFSAHIGAKLPSNHVAREVIQHCG